LINKLFNCARVRNELARVRNVLARGKWKTWVVRDFWDTLYNNCHFRKKRFTINFLAVGLIFIRKPEIK